MATFIYTARDKSGATIQGHVLASDRTTAAAELNNKGLTPLLVKEEGADQKGLNFNLNLDFLQSKRVSLNEKVIFSRQFATMINAGVPITKSLGILKEQTESAYLKSIITIVAKKVEGGSTLASAMAEHPKMFSSIYVNMVKAGETGGILDQVLDRLAIQQEKDAEIVGKVRGAMIYPSVIFSVTIAAFIFLMTVIVPGLAVIFDGLGGKLPVYTLVMLAISKFLVHYGIFVGIGAAIGGYFFVRWIHTTRGKRIWDGFLIKAPIIGPIVVKVNVARFARTFGSLMASGISVLDALKATSSALGNSVYQEELLQIANEVKNGKSISEPMKKSKHFPAIVAQMVSVGEETGEMDSILLKLADFFEKEVDNVISNITSIIEPIIIIVLGAMVGMIVISVFGPISNLSTTVTDS